MKDPGQPGLSSFYKCYFTHNYNMPFLMSYFTLDPKPKNYTHPNGVRGISKVIYRTGKKNADALRHLVQDETLQVIDDAHTCIEAVEYRK
ncbi:MAG: hypothetical protein K6G23_02375 [Lachnospiraceae bacterium]|nr:hypothetical protein [Lachnospiraceae bacterium]